MKTSILYISALLIVPALFLGCNKVKEELKIIVEQPGIYSAPTEGRPGEVKEFVGKFGELSSDLHIFFDDREAAILSRAMGKVPPGGIVYGDVDSVSVQRVQVLVPDGLKKGVVTVRVQVNGQLLPAPAFTVTEPLPLVPGNVWVSTYAGSDPNGPAELKDGPLRQASFGLPSAMVVTPDSIIYVADSDPNSGLSYIRKVANGRVTTIAGGFGAISGMATDASGMLYIADIGYNPTNTYPLNRICMVDPVTGKVSTFAGATDSLWVSSSGYFKDGPAQQALFCDVRDLTFDNYGHLYLTEYNSNSIRKIAAGQVSTPLGQKYCEDYAGSRYCAAISGFEDGFGAEVKITSPLAMATAGNGKIYFTEEAATIREFNPLTNEVATIAGAPYETLQTYGPLKTSRFYKLLSIVPDGQQNLLAIDYGYILKIDLKEETVAILAGAGYPGYKDGAGDEAVFNQPSDLGYDAHGNLYVLDKYNRLIRKITVL